MFYLLLLPSACQGPAAIHPPSTDPVEELAELAPLLESPAEAEDLDPAEGIVHLALEAARATYTVGGLQIEGYAYNGQNPGPTIRAQVGDTVVVDFQNLIDTPTTVHWHGLKVPNDMDGVEWVSEPLLPGATFTYAFTATQAGTFWYHPHLDVEHQVDLGLYGAIVIEEPADPVPDRELVIVWDVWAEADPADEHTAPDPGTLLWTANGLTAPRVELAAGEVVRVRMINASNAGYLDLSWPGLRQIGSDQGLLPAPIAPASALLAPGDRADFEWAASNEDFEVATAMYTPSGGSALGDPLTLLSVEMTDSAAPGSALPWSGPTDPPSADPTWTDIVYVLQGGAAAEDWLINGESYPEVTVETATLGEASVIEVRNLSATEHPFHLHGQSFEVLSVDGVPPAMRTVEDTVNVKIRQRVRLRVLADNPGDWMVHCHLLGHEASGMMTVLRIE
ncbi:MAG: multicopper oxidase family protein [Pseudomonadota bacterium]|nr:multicopper oxidase family protein [Pseudomonadota bacterium]